MDKLLLSLTGAVVAGSLTLISPEDWSPRVRRAYVMVPGVLVAAGSSLLLIKLTDRPAAAISPAGSAPAVTDEEFSTTPQPHPLVTRVAVPLTLGAVTCGFQAGSLWIDAALERGLLRLGATHPRRWMAAIAVATSLGMDAAGARATGRAPDERPASAS